MNVGDLIKLLNTFNPNLKVYTTTTRLNLEPNLIVEQKLVPIYKDGRQVGYDDAITINYPG